MTEKRIAQVPGLSKLWKKSDIDRDWYVKILPIYPYGRICDDNVNDNNYQQSGADWYIDSIDSLTTYFIKDLNQNVLTCVKCKDTSTQLEPCNNCGSKEFDSRFKCIKCLQIHQQRRWICKQCNCDNPIENTLTHFVEIEAKAKKKKEGCFVATICYGDYNSREVIVLRNFRDKKLLHSFWGKIFVKIYYIFSPSFASLIDKSEILKKVIRNYFLEPLVSRLNRNEK